MRMRCPICKECLESLGHINGTIYHYCILCGIVYKLVAGGKLEQVNSLSEFSEERKEDEI